jgi:hypothetical protein
MAGIADWLGIGKTVSDTATALTNGAANIVSAAKANPTAEINAELEALRLQTRIEIEKLVEKSVESAREFAVQYEGAAKDVPKWIAVFRSLIRPLITILFSGIFATATVIDFIASTKGDEAWRLIGSLPQGFWWAFGVILGFWFGGRAVEHVVEKFSGRQ